jgi:hypothetical protein
MHRGRFFYRRFSSYAAVLACLCLVAAPSAIAATAAATDEYVAQQPSAGGESQGVAGQTGSSGSNGAAGTAAQTVASPGNGSGSLPFTGYPMTTLLWVVLALILVGLGIRFTLGGHRRLRAATRS